MTAQVHTRRVDGGAPNGKRRNKAVAFGLAGLVAAAGIAGVVVTSSAYFTDVKEIGSNTISVRGVDIDAFATGNTVSLASFPLTEMAPLAGATASEFATAPSNYFDVRNVSTSPFKYKVEITDITVTQRDGSNLPGTKTATALALGDVTPHIKLNLVRGASGTPAFDNTKGVTLATLITTPQVLTDNNLTDSTALLQKQDNAVGVTNDESVVGIKAWIEQATLTSSSMSQADQNLLQNLKVNYKIKLTATQLTAAP